MLLVINIKKNTKEPIRKNIGKIFRGHNIIEYKSPEDYLSIDDYYKVHAYAFFYKSDGATINAISIREVTITFVSHGYPKSMVQELVNTLGYKIQKQEDGIYYITGDVVPIQLIVTSKLSEKNNLWLKNLTNKLKAKEIPSLIEDYEKHKNNKLYDAILDVIIQANMDEWEAGSMCNALEELLNKKVQEREDEILNKLFKEQEEVLNKKFKEQEEVLRQKSRQEGRQEGRREGRQENLLQLIYKKIQKQKTIEQIADELEETVETILPLYNKLKEENASL